MLTNGVVNLATILPSAPGFVGTFDLPIIAVLRFLGVGEALATAYTVVVHATFWLSSTIFGAVYMAAAGLRWSDLRKEGDGPRMNADFCVDWAMGYAYGRRPKGFEKPLGSLGDIYGTCFNCHSRV